jgi:hypothetical protein
MCWDNVGENMIIGLELIQITMEMVPLDL